MKASRIRHKGDEYVVWTEQFNGIDEILVIEKDGKKVKLSPELLDIIYLYLGLGELNGKVIH